MSITTKLVENVDFWNSSSTFRSRWECQGICIFNKVPRRLWCRWCKTTCFKKEKQVPTCLFLSLQHDKHNASYTRNIYLLNYLFNAYNKYLSNYLFNHASLYSILEFIKHSGCFIWWLPNLYIIRPSIKAHISSLNSSIEHFYLYISEISTYLKTIFIIFQAKPLSLISLFSQPWHYFLSHPWLISLIHLCMLNSAEFCFENFLLPPRAHLYFCCSSPS